MSVFFGNGAVGAVTSTPDVGPVAFHSSSNGYPSDG